MTLRRTGSLMLALCLVLSLSVGSLASQADTQSSAADSGNAAAPMIPAADPATPEVTTADGGAAAMSESAGTMINDSAASQSLFAAVNKARTAAGLTEMSYDSGLEKVALAYAEELAKAGSGFRKTTDYLTLPSGERIVSLVSKTGYGSVQDFYYYVWQNPGSDAATYVQSTALFTTATAGTYENIGIACASNGSYSVVIMMFSNSLGSTSSVHPTPNTPPASSEAAAPAETSEPAASASEPAASSSEPAASSAASDASSK